MIIIPCRPLDQISSTCYLNFWSARHLEFKRQVPGTAVTLILEMPGI